MKPIKVKIDTIKVAYISSESSDIRDLLERLKEFYATYPNIITQDIQFLGIDAAKVFYAEPA
ncbi:MAG: hypothetical protein Q7R34_08245 [Dehalococcoidia bacterium]|nr:hypothetical protein [Dehalococcoidia bacterium]